ncbi:cytochrome C oxidase subunit IV family protein [Zhongshania aliphaticivorans]|uniref:cytochrome C oxidase subunit IV family protein n=1 Tax=Zhongshania aliphaticivorans TaxID=1470434 RepID=UPI0013302800|nr:cytochrome C oxidase subunit IV family protein [Zhongshania aliphaticivorans]
MRNLIFSKETAIWIVLMLISIFSWVVGINHGMLFEKAFLESAAILILAFFKVRLVIMHFMEVGHAPTTLKLSCEAWVFVSCIGLIIMTGGQFQA